MPLLPFHPRCPGSKAFQGCVYIAIDSLDHNIDTKAPVCDWRVWCVIGVFGVFPEYARLVRAFGPMERSYANT